MKKAFTMVELIFVIVIIGILAAIAIPKMVISRDNAQAAICIGDVNTFMLEVSTTYAREGYNTFKTLYASDMTNLSVSSSIPAGKNGIAPDNLIDGTTGVSYYCDGEEIVKINGIAVNGDYNLTISAVGARNSKQSPAANIALSEIMDHLLQGTTRTYRQL